MRLKEKALFDVISTIEETVFIIIFLCVKHSANINKKHFTNTTSRKFN
jgi:hypothetical protein